MHAMSSRLLAATVSALLLASFAWSPGAEAAGGRAAGGGGARAGGGGGGGREAAAARAPAGQKSGAAARQAPQERAPRADARTNEVRSASTNSVNNNRQTNVNRSQNTNVNANRNVNVNVNGNNNNNNNNNCCGGWDNDYHPVAGAVAVGAAVAVTAAAIGSLTSTVPAGCVPVNYGGMVYQQCGSTWYQPQGAQFIVVNPPY